MPWHMGRYCNCICKEARGPPHAAIIKKVSSTSHSCSVADVHTCSAAVQCSRSEAQSQTRGSMVTLPKQNGMQIIYMSPEPWWLTCACQPGLILRAGGLAAARLRQRRDLRPQAPCVHRHLQHHQVLSFCQRRALLPPGMPAPNRVPTAGCCGGVGAFCLRSPCCIGITSHTTLHPCCRARLGTAQGRNLCGEAGGHAGRQRAQVGHLPPQQPPHRARKRLGHRHCRWLPCPFRSLRRAEVANKLPPLQAANAYSS